MTRSNKPVVKDIILEKMHMANITWNSDYMTVAGHYSVTIGFLTIVFHVSEYRDRVVSVKMCMNIVPYLLGVMGIKFEVYLPRI
jgi:hypothetical protein